MQKYGWHGISAGIRLQPTHHAETVVQFDRLDQNYLKLWLDYTYGGLYNRGVLTERVRLLVAIAQAVAMDEMEVVESHLKSALVHKLKPREILETLLQITVYLGTPKVTRAIRIFKKIMTKAGRMKELKVGQLPLDGVTKSRNL